MSKKAVILTDLDKEGRKLYAILKTQLQFLGVKVDNYFREFLLKNTRVRQIEGLNNVLDSECLIIANKDSIN